MSSQIRAKKKSKSKNNRLVLIRSITSLPKDVTLDILARVPRCNYLNLSLVSKHFSLVSKHFPLVSSSELYVKRSLLGCTEACFNAFLYNPKTNTYRWYILRRKAKSNRLVLIRSLPAMHCYQSFVAMGSKIYVFTGIYGKDMTLGLLSIDCRPGCRSDKEKEETLPNMPVPMEDIVAESIDGKIYVFGHCNGDTKMKKTMVVFNTEEKMWEHEITKLDMEIAQVSPGCVVATKDKIYMRDRYNSFVYSPKEDKWETDKMMSSKKWSSACFVDDVLYYYDYQEKKLRAYDTKERLWRVVKGVGDLLQASFQSHMVNYDGKLVVFLHKKDRSSRQTEIWCAEITLQSRENGEISGKVARLELGAGKDCKAKETRRLSLSSYSLGVVDYPISFKITHY